MKKKLIWFKGKVIPHEDALVNVMSPTSQFGLNVFEGIRGYWNSNENTIFLFRFDDHINRLFESCKIIGLNCPYSKSEIWQSVINLLEASNFNGDIAIRLTLFVDGDGSWSSMSDPDMFISPILKPRKAINNLAGASASISSWQRINDLSMPPRVKTGANYIGGRYAQIEATRSGFDLPIFLNNQGTVSEGAGACLFMLRNNKLITPSLQSSILESITRDTIIKLSEYMGMPVIERNIERTELYLADEIFLCGSAAEITPIINIDGISVGSGDAGSITKKILETYLNITSNNNLNGLDNKISQNWLSKFYKKI